MPLNQADVPDGAVLMVDVVPVHEVSRPLSGVPQGLEAFGRELRAVLCGAEQRSTKALSSLTRGREYAGRTPSQCSIARTEVALMVELSRFLMLASIEGVLSRRQLLWRGGAGSMDLTRPMRRCVAAKNATQAGGRAQTQRVRPNISDGPERKATCLSTFV